MFPSSTPLSDMDYSTDCLSRLSGLSIASYNIRSFLSKKDDVACLLDKAKLDILCLNETFLTPDIPNSALDISGYSFFRSDRSEMVNKNGGGGILVYVKNNRNVSLIPGGSFSNNLIESCWLRLDLPRSKSAVICSFYRAPDTNLTD